MPSYVTHHIFAATVQRVTGGHTAHVAALYPAAYRWGAQGPDPLVYYHAPFSGTARRLALRMHEMPPAALFEALCAAAADRHDTAALAYVSGFCTHYALDRVSYPFIEAQADRLADFMPGYSPAARRRLVESDLDCVMIGEYISAEPACFEGYRLLDPHAAECTVLARVLAEAAHTACETRLSPAMVYRALHDTRRVLRLTHSGIPARGRVQKLERLTGRAGLTSSLIRPAEPLSIDCANTGRRPWQANGAERTDSFCDLFNAAVPLAVSLQRAVLQRYYQNEPLDPRFFPTNFYGETPQK